MSVAITVVIERRASILKIRTNFSKIKPSFSKNSLIEPWIYDSIILDKSQVVVYNGVKSYNLYK